MAKQQATSIHFKAAKADSEAHLLRLKKLDYLIPNTRPNEVLMLRHQADVLAEAQERYLAKVGQKMQSRMTPIREAVVVINEDTTMDQLQELGRRLEERFGLRVIQIAMHFDEGYQRGKGKAKRNLHAHMVADWTDHKTGKSLKLNKHDMSEMQDIVAEVLGMQRGVSSDKKHLDAIQYKVQAQEQYKEQLDAEVKTLEDRRVDKQQQLDAESGSKILAAGATIASSIGSGVANLFGAGKYHEAQEQLKTAEAQHKQAIADLKGKHQQEVAEYEGKLNKKDLEVQALEQKTAKKDTEIQSQAVSLNRRYKALQIFFRAAERTSAAVRAAIDYIRQHARSGYNVPTKGCESVITAVDATAGQQADKDVKGILGYYLADYALTGQGIEMQRKSLCCDQAEELAMGKWDNYLERHQGLSR